MFAVAFDLEIAQVNVHLNNPASAYAEIRRVLTGFGFQWTQGSLYILEKEDMSVLFSALNALKALPWFPASVRDIRAFRVEQWSDFTAMMKAPASGAAPTGGSGRSSP